MKTALEILVESNEGRTQDTVGKWTNKQCMIMFAKLHVKAALKKATKTVEEYRAWGDEEMINNCYPDKLIK